MITLGHIAYSNVYPIHGGLLAGAVPHPFHIVHGLPTHLNRLLAGGAIDVCASSSIAYAREPERYVILPNLAVAADGPVRSIFLISRVPVGELADRRIAVTTASATSVVLLRILLHYQYRVEAHLTPMAPDLEAMLEAAPAALLIGDDAIAAVRRARGLYVHDLGADWHAWTGLPMVFAIWHARRDTLARDPRGVARAQRALLASKRWGLANLDALALRFSDDLGLDAPFLASYWRGLDTNLGPREQAGLRRYYELAADLGEIPAAPELVFWQAEVADTGEGERLAQADFVQPR